MPKLSLVVVVVLAFGVILAGMGGQGQKPHLLIVAAEDEYQTEKTLPPFAREHLSNDLRVSFVFADPKQRHHLPGLEQIKNANVLLVSVRRRPLERDQLTLLRDWVKAGKPVVGIRTASHAFARKGNEILPEGVIEWEQFDREVLGCHYQGHFGMELKPAISLNEMAKEHSMLKGIDVGSFRSEGSLYRSEPLAVGTTLLLRGEITGKQPEPVAWTYQRPDGGKTFYTSLGHPQDFQNPAFVKLLSNAIRWAAEAKISKE